MAFISRGRSLSEIMIAVMLVGFLTGFVAVLCVGNYYRAKRAMERQRQRRMARLSGGTTGGSPSHSSTSSHYSDDPHPISSLLRQQAQQQQQRRRAVEEGTDSLLLNTYDDRAPTARITAV